jgi:hypothetical protein
MGIRGELFSSKLNCRGRSYFFNVKENRTGDIFLNIVESKPTENAEFDRRSIVVFKEDMREFLQAFEKALRISTPPLAEGPSDRPIRGRRSPLGAEAAGKMVVKSKQSGEGKNERPEERCPLIRVLLA